MKKVLLVIVFSTVAILSLSAQVTGDPWIKKVYNDNYRREPNVFEYNIQNYNNGHWNNYNELVKYITEYQQNLASSGISFKISAKTFANNTLVVGIFQNGTQVAVDLVASGGGNLVASGGGNLIASGGGNLVASGGGNLVASGGGNIAVFPTTKGASFGGSYTLASAGTKVVKTSGSGALIIK